MNTQQKSPIDEHAGTWWDGSLRFQRLLAQQVIPRLEYFDRIAPDWRSARVLDLGCGGGFMAEALARRGAIVTGVDPSVASLDAARRHAQREGLSIGYLEGTGEKIPLESASMDRVVCVDVLEHVENLGRVIAEVSRVLRPGGLFFFDTFNRSRFARFMMITISERVLRLLPRGSHDPSKFTRPEELRALLTANGLAAAARFIGMGIVRINRHLDPELGLTSSTGVMYAGYATKLG